jgi:hypothetical protein
MSYNDTDTDDEQEPRTAKEITRTGEVRIAQPIGNSHEHESEGWLRAGLFQPSAMRRLTVGQIGTGKTVGAMAAASRVLDTIPDARIVVFNSIPGAYDPLAHTLSENNRGRETGDIPSAKRFRVGDGSRLPVSASDLPAVSIIEPEAAALPDRQESLSQAVEDFCEGLYGAHRQWPTYLILDDARWMFRSDSMFGLNEMIQTQREHEALAVQVVTQTLDGGLIEAAMGCGEDVQRPPRLFNTFDLYQSASRTQRKRLGLSPEDAEFLRNEAVAASSVDDESEGAVREAAPTGLCKTTDENWQRVRYTLTEREAETLLASSGYGHGTVPTEQEADL